MPYSRPLSAGIRNTLLLVILAALGCTEPDAEVDPAEPPSVTRERMDREVGEAVEATRLHLAEKRQEYAESFRARLAALDVRIADLQQRGEQLREEARIEWAEELAVLKAKRQQAGEKLAEIQAASGKTLEDLKAGMEAAWADLEQSFREAAQAEGDAR